MAKLEDRVTAVEERLDMEVRLAASRDRDLADLKVTLRSHTVMLQALQEGQATHTARLNTMDTRLNTIDKRLDSLEDKVGSLDGRVGSLEGRVASLQVTTAAGFAAIGSQLQVLIDRDADGRR